MSLENAIEKLAEAINNFSEIYRGDWQDNVVGKQKQAKKPAPAVAEPAPAVAEPAPAVAEPAPAVVAGKYAEAKTFDLDKMRSILGVIIAKPGGQDAIKSALAALNAPVLSKVLPVDFPTLLDQIEKNTGSEVVI